MADKKEVIREKLVKIGLVKFSEPFKELRQLTLDVINDIPDENSNERLDLQQLLKEVEGVLNRQRDPQDLKDFERLQGSIMTILRKLV